MFCNILLKYMSQSKCKKVIVCWDKSGSYRRKAIFPAHKEYEPIDESTLEGKLDRLKLDGYVKARQWLHDRCLPQLGIGSIMIKGLEADDIAYALTNLGVIPSDQLDTINTFLTEDNDWQESLIPGWVIYKPIAEKVITWEEFSSQYTNIHPKAVADPVKNPKLIFIYCRAMIGKGTEIPGVFGIGPSFARKIALKITSGETIGKGKKEESVAQAIKDGSLLRDIRLADYGEITQEELAQVYTAWRKAIEAWEISPNLLTFIDLSEDINSTRFAGFDSYLSF
jgi:hypothetical protein